MPDASGLLKWSFVGLALIVAAAFVAAVHWAGARTAAGAVARRRSALLAAVLTAAWLAATLAAAAAGRLSFSARPPTMLLLLAATGVLALALGLSPLGARLVAGLPLAVLVGYQGFRVLVELLLHRAYEEGLAPVQMTYAGRNFDIVTGITAIVVAALLAADRGMPRRAVPWVVLAWNLLGLGLLANVLGVALLSSPTPFRKFFNEPSNVWVTRAPWVWLPTVMVLAALLGHVLVFRRILGKGGTGRV